jgi:hypothetical protein
VVKVESYPRSTLTAVADPEIDPLILQDDDDGDQPMNREPGPPLKREKLKALFRRLDVAGAPQSRFSDWIDGFSSTASTIVARQSG